MGAFAKELIPKVLLALFVIIIPCGAALCIGKVESERIVDMQWEDIPRTFNNWISTSYASLALLADLLIFRVAVTFVHDKEEYGYVFIVLFAFYNMLRNIAILCINIGTLSNSSYFHEPTRCKSLAFLINFAGLSVFSLMSIISVIIIAGSPSYKNKCNCRCKISQFFKKQLRAFWDNQKWSFVKIILINTIICGFFGALPFITGSYGQKGTTCTILQRKEEEDPENAMWDKIMRFISYYMHFLVAIILSIYAILRVLFLQKCSEAPIDAIMENNPPLQRSWNKFKTYPFVLVLAFIVPFTRRTMTEYFGMHQDDYLWLNWIIAISYRITAGSFGFYIFLFHGRFGKFLQIHNWYFCRKKDENNDISAPSSMKENNSSIYETGTIGSVPSIRTSSASN